jgi:hypothetical protein
MVGNLQKFPKRSLRNMMAIYFYFLIFKNILEKYGWKFIEISKNIFEKYGGKFLENFPKDP